MFTTNTKKRLDAVDGRLVSLEQGADAQHKASCAAFREADNRLAKLDAHLSALMAHLGLAWERVPAQGDRLRVVAVPRATASTVTVGDGRKAKGGGR